MKIHEMHHFRRRSGRWQGCLVVVLTLFFCVNSLYALSGVDETLDRAKALRQKGRFEETYALCDSLHTAMDSAFRVQYDEAIVPVRLEYNSEEMKMEADSERNSLMFRVCLLAIVLSGCGLGVYFFIRKQNRRVAESAHAMKDATQKAEIAEKSKSLFLSNMTHEIRTPLNAISGFSDVLAMEGVGEEFYGEAAEIIEMNSNLLQNLIDDVISTACMDVTEMKFRIAPCDIVKLSRNVTEMISKIKKTDADMRFESDFDRLIINTDALRVQQVLVNVLVNATKFCKSGSIVLQVKQDNDLVRVSVTDTGIGIPKEKQATVFQRFERVKEGAEGFGLGLSICQLIIERLSGRIWVDGDYTGGARFLFTLPIQQEIPEGQEGGVML